MITKSSMRKLASRQLTKSPSTPSRRISGRRGAARFGSARRSAARFGSACRGAARFGSARRSAARCGSARRGAVRCGAARQVLVPVLLVLSPIYFGPRDSLAVVSSS
jgi:hypothetical protein